MKLLFITQKVDEKDPVLGFFVDWIKEVAKKFDRVEVICLEKGNYELPEKVKVFSLGKENLRRERFLAKWRYILRFWKIIFRERKNYELVFVHMNQEYVLLGWWMWKILGKKIYLWRNHKQGSFLTKLAGVMAEKVFYTSPYSYTARFRNGVRMPVGIKLKNNQETRYNSRIYRGEILKILCLGRVAPVKRVEVAIEAAKILKKKGVKFQLDIVGDALEKDEEYFDSLKSGVKNGGLEGEVRFWPGVNHEEALKIILEHDTLINVTETGSMDKTIFEAGAAGVIVVSSNEALAGIWPKGWSEVFRVEATGRGVAEGILSFMNLSGREREIIREKVRENIKREQSLEVLVERLEKIFREE